MASLKKVFIDGSAGTTGLRIRERLARRPDLELVVLPEEVRKDVEARRQALNGADVAFLCLPDAAAVEAVALVENPDTVIIDTSTAHRVADGWEYGFPELAGQRERIAGAKRIANPGCHASGFVALVEPLVRAGVVASDEKLCAFSLTGYSGGGKKMIADYVEKLNVERLKSAEDVSGGEPSTFQPFNFSTLYLGGRQYALGQKHKHLPEMARVCGLDFAPCFSPIVVPHLSGMEVTVQLFRSQLRPLSGPNSSSVVSDPSSSPVVSGPSSSSVVSDPIPTLDDLKGLYRSYYADNGLVRFVDDPAAAEGNFLSSAALSGRDDMEISVYGNDERIVLVSRFDNLGKGASGAAIQNMNIVLGVDETEGLQFPV